jgi:hypothetical protein
MRIRDITDERLDEGPIWNKVKAGVKKMFTPKEKKHPLVAYSGDIRNIFGKLIKGEQLSRQDMSVINSVYRKI